MTLTEEYGVALVGVCSLSAWAWLVLLQRASVHMALTVGTHIYTACSFSVVAWSGVIWLRWKIG
jgi:hypothetical protein